MHSSFNSERNSVVETTHWGVFQKKQHTHTDFRVLTFVFVCAFTLPVGADGDIWGIVGEQTVGLVASLVWDAPEERQEDEGCRQVCVLTWHTCKAGFEAHKVEKVIKGTKRWNILRQLTVFLISAYVFLGQLTYAHAMPWNLCYKLGAQRKKCFLWKFSPSFSWGKKKKR